MNSSSTSTTGPPEPSAPACIALTFDDGPGAVTSAVLDALRRHGALATFNVLGERIAGRERLLRRVAEEGHEFGVHGWSHGDHRDDPDARAAAAGRTADTVTAVCGTRPRLFRPPFGLTDRRLEEAVAAQGLTTVLWDVDPRDFEEPGAEVIRDRTLMAIGPGSIVLLHDDRPELAATAVAVDAVLEDLRRRAWSAVTVSELLRSGDSRGYSTRSRPPNRNRSPG
jgi:peptidoglycan/xylan/chitin deacetylase (PgdA/CDA1 family)